MNTHSFTGTGVAVITPFDTNNCIDYAALGNIVEHLIAGRVEYIVVMGTTGESAVLTADEKRAVSDFVREKVNGRLPLVIGIGGNDTAEITRCIEKFDFQGYAGVLSVSPYYNKPNQRGLYEHYKAVASSCQLPIILYNVPGRTASNLNADTTVQLATDFPNIVAVKEASANFTQIGDIIKNKPLHFEVISGDDALALPLISMGAKGVISVIANALPYSFSQLVRHALAGEYAHARELHYKMNELFKLLFADGNPAGIKVAMSTKKLCLNTLRLPLVPACGPVAAEIAAQMSLFSN